MAAIWRKNQLLVLRAVIPRIQTVVSTTCSM